MSVTLHSTRFGRLEIPEEAVLEFPAGLIGLGGTAWSLLAPEEGSSFLWLHSLDQGDLAIPVTNPWEFFPDYEVELGDAETERIGLEDAEQTSVYVTVRAAQRLEDFTANLAAPILIAGTVGHQVINQAAAGFPVRALMFATQAGAAAA